MARSSLQMTVSSTLGAESRSGGGSVMCASLAKMNTPDEPSIHGLVQNTGREGIAMI